MFTSHAMLGYQGPGYPGRRHGFDNLTRIDDESERQKIPESLFEYCKLDTIAMVMIWRELSNITEIS